MQIPIFTADCCGNPKNCVYPHAAAASTEEEFKRLVANDHMFAAMTGGRRSNENFSGTAVIAADCDNDHSDNPRDWFTPEDVIANFPDVPCVIYTSRNHMKPKGAKSARPRFHAVFTISRVADAAAYSALMKRLQEYFPVFDANAADPARFFFGNPDTQVRFCPGGTPLDRFLDQEGVLRREPDPPPASSRQEPIPEGRRNRTLYRDALRVLTRLGVCEESRSAFLERSKLCVPPLPDHELAAIWSSACKTWRNIIAKRPGYIPSGEYPSSAAAQDRSPPPDAPQWRQPRSLDAPPVPEFPVDALPPVLADLVNAVAESIQVPRGMVASAVLALLSVCLQGKYKVQAKPGWTEPVNLYVYNVLSASERKSAVLNLLIRPILEYENRYNRDHAAEIESSMRTRNALEKSISLIEDQLAKGMATPDELNRAILKVQEHEVKKKLKLFSDNITMEKLGSVMAANNDRASILTTEPGIFDIMAGAYSNSVNFDLILKAFSGDPSRTERIGRGEERLDHPTLTMLLMGQPCTLESLMSNSKFKGRGVTSRFLYCIPDSMVGSRRYLTEEIPEAVKMEYEELLQNLLTDFYPSDPDVPPVITLSPEAFRLHRQFYEEMEHLQGTEFAYDEGLKEWAGKLPGNVLRIAALLTRVRADFPYEAFRNPFLEPEPDLYDDSDEEIYASRSSLLEVDESTMENAVLLGRYYLANARKAFSLMGSGRLNTDCRYVLEKILEKRYASFTSREIFRVSRRFAKMDEIRPVLQQLADLEYLALREAVSPGNSRTRAEVWLVNPLLYGQQPAPAGAPPAA